LREFSQTHKAWQLAPHADRRSEKTLNFNAHPTSTVEPRKTAMVLAMAGALRVHKTVRERDSSVIDFSPARRKAEMVGEESLSFS